LKNFRKKLKNDTNKSPDGTSEGNYRYCMDNHYTWALNHLVQTTSLIYKKSLIRVPEEMRTTDFFNTMMNIYQIEKIYLQKTSVRKLKNMKKSLGAPRARYNNAFI
jgi:hypothetical protein